MFRIFKCKKCNQIICKVMDSGAKLSCCGEEMVELIPNTAIGAVEKHVPVVSIEKNMVHVAVGEVLHPTTPAHYIPFIILETTNGVQMKELKPEESPEATFSITEGEEVLHAYAYCNLHSLWKK